MSSTTTQKREEIRLDAEQLREAESSRHEISKLAHELLLQRLNEKQAANGRTYRKECARVESEHSAETIRLAETHKKEDGEFVDARFAMIAKFDAQRDKLLRVSLAKKLEENEEVRRHAQLVDSLQAKLALDDQVAEQELQRTVEQYLQGQCIYCSRCGGWNQWRHGEPNATCCNCGQAGLNFDSIAEVIQARAQAQQSTAARHKDHEELVDRHKAEWKLRQEDLRFEAVNGRELRLARLDLEHDFQSRLVKDDQLWKTIQQRHDKELRMLATELRSALEAVHNAHERATAKLIVERQQVERWWKHFSNEAEASLQRIDEEETHALSDFDLQTAAVTVKAESEGRAVEAEVVCGAIADHREEEEERVKGVEMGVVHAVNEEHKGTRRASDEEGIVTSTLETTLSLTATTYHPEDPASTSSNNGHRRGSARRSDLPADAVQIPALPSTGSSHTTAMASPFDLQFELAVDTARPPDTHDKSNLMKSAFYTEPAGSVPNGSGSLDGRDSESDFVEI